MFTKSADFKKVPKHNYFPINKIWTKNCFQIIYKVCQGRVLDYKRKFIEAASRYNELSYKPLIHEAERITALKNAMICTILASAGKDAQSELKLPQGWSSCLRFYW